MDRLAAAGTLFTDAYTPCPACVPAFATGKYVHQIGTCDNAIPYEGRIPSWHHLLRERHQYHPGAGRRVCRTHCCAWAAVPASSNAAAATNPRANMPELIPLSPHACAWPQNTRKRRRTQAAALDPTRRGTRSRFDVHLTEGTACHAKVAGGV